MQQAVQESRRQEGAQRDAAEGAGQRERAALQRCELLAEERDQLNSQLDLDQQHALRCEQQVNPTLRHESTHWSHLSDSNLWGHALVASWHSTHGISALLRQCDQLNS